MGPRAARGAPVVVGHGLQRRHLYQCLAAAVLEVHSVGGKGIGIIYFHASLHRAI